MPRQIIHLDLDAFFCAVEERKNPELRGLPFAVGGRPEERGVVSSCSYAARQHGVRSAMPMARALHLCEGLRILPPDYAAYSKASSQVMERVRQLSPLVEQISIDEAFVDVSDLATPAEEIALELQKSILQDLELPCSLGIATNKLVAKIATDFGKASNRSGGPPNALTIVPPGDESKFLSELPTLALWGIGPKTADRLRKLGVETIGQLANMPESELVHLFGKNGHDLYRHSRGIDDRPVVVSHEARSISREVTFARDIPDRKILLQTLKELSEDVGSRLRKEGLAGTTIKLKLRWPNFVTISRQITLPSPTNLDEEIFKTASQLFANAWQPPGPVRLIGVGVSGLGEPFHQLSLWEANPKRQLRLQKTIEELQERFGDQVVKMGRGLSRREDKN